MIRGEASGRVREESEKTPGSTLGRLASDQSPRVDDDEGTGERQPLVGRGCQAIVIHFPDTPMQHHSRVYCV